MKFTVLVPVLNGEKFIIETLESIFKAAQKISFDHEVFIKILDGESNDKTLVLIKNWFISNYKKNIFFQIESMTDDGMYHALSRKITQELDGILSYLNSGDLYLENTFVDLITVFEDPDVNWVTGINNSLDLDGKVSTSQTFIYRKELIKKGVYGIFPFTPVIQQESTFWRAHLTGDIDKEELKKFKLAGDFYLWKHLSEKADLISVKKKFAIFRFHLNQLSSDKATYRREVRVSKNSGKNFWYIILIIDLICYRFGFRFLNAAKILLE